MELEKGELASSPASETRALSVFRSALSFSLLGSLIWLVSCAAPGEPIERKPQVPTAISDLAAQQQGNDVILTFTLPKDTVDHRPLRKTPAIEIYRGFDPPAATKTGTQEPLFLILTIPPAMVANYSEKNRIRVINSLDSNDLSPHVGWTASYTVRTRASVKKESADSNHAGVRVYPAPDPIPDLHAEVAHSGIILKWTPPRRTIVGPTPSIDIPSIAAYHIYRAETAPELQPSTPPAASGAVSGVPKLKVPLARIGESTEPTFQDKQIEFGKTYVYSVRSLVQYSDVAIESADSNLVLATPRAIFPPEAPQNLTVVLVPAQGENSAYLDLSWAISAETDIAGYNVYRSEQDGVPGRRLNSELLLTPAFRDMNAVPGHQYVYTATAVDRAGNESPASASASGSIPVEGQPRP
jgi:hypothetical protein